jgi:hypothetical protein
MIMTVPMSPSASSMILTSLDRKLLDWLDNDTSRFEKYITAHPEAADRIDQLLALGTDVQRMLSEALTESLAGPVGLFERLTERITPGTDTAASSVVLDIFGVGPATVNTWL